MTRTGDQVRLALVLVSNGAAPCPTDLPRTWAITGVAADVAEASVHPRRKALLDSRCVLGRRGWSEDILQSKLHDSWISRRQNPPKSGRRTNTSKCGRRAHADRKVEVGSIRRIEYFVAELNELVLSNRKVLEQGSVKGSNSGTY